jgi:membrane protein required for colicin V production
MNTLDIIILVPLAWFAFKGFRNGFIIEIAVLIALVLGLFAAIHFSEYTAGVLIEKFNFHGGNVRLVSYVVTFLVTMILVYFLGRFISTLVKSVGLGIVNRLAGLLLGVVKAFLIVGAFLMLFGKIDPHSYLIPQKEKDSSLFYKPVVTVMPLMFPVLQRYTEKVKGFIQK